MFLDRKNKEEADDVIDHVITQINLFTNAYEYDVDLKYSIYLLEPDFLLNFIFNPEVFEHFKKEFIAGHTRK